MRYPISVALFACVLMAVSSAAPAFGASSDGRYVSGPQSNDPSAVVKEETDSTRPSAAKSDQGLDGATAAQKRKSLKAKARLRAAARKSARLARARKTRAKNARIRAAKKAKKMAQALARKRASIRRKVTAVRVARSVLRKASSKLRAAKRDEVRALNAQKRAAKRIVVAQAQKKRAEARLAKLTKRMPADRAGADIPGVPPKASPPTGTQMQPQ